MTAPLTLPPIAPSTLRPDTFSTEMDAMLEWLETHVEEENALLPLIDGAAAAGTAATAAAAAAAASAASALAAPGTNATSTTSLSVSPGTKTLTIQTGKAFAPGAWLNLARTSDVTQSMLGTVQSYTSGTGALVVIVAAGDFSGSGTYTDWTITQSARRSATIGSVDLTVTGPSVRPVLLCDFINSRRLDSRFTYSMTSPLTYFDSTGVMRTAAAGQICFDHDPVTGKGLGIPRFEARTNVLLWNRDLTNAAWAKSNVATALTQTGVDAAANSATLCTATAAGATVMQAVTLASSARFFTAYVKRITGTGTVEMTLDGGATWTAITGSINSINFTRCRIPAQTLANPQAGFRLGTSGDAIAVDYTQNEGGIFETPAIATTTAAVTRAEATLSMPISAVRGFNAKEGVFHLAFTTGGDLVTAYAAVIYDAATTSGLFIIAANSGGTGPYAEVVNSGTSQALVDGSATANTSYSTALAYKAGDFSYSHDGRAVVNGTFATVPPMTTLYLGSNASGTGSTLNGWVGSVALYPRDALDTELMAISTQ